MLLAFAPAQSDDSQRLRRALELLGELLGLGLDVVDGADHVEGGLRERVVLAGEDLLERADGLLQGDELALETSEDLGDLEGLRHETLDLTSTLDLSSFIGQRFRIYPKCTSKLTVSLSSSDNSSIPRMAMISWSDL